MNKLDQLPWPLIIGMGALALLRPFLSITGIMDRLERPLGPILLTLLISLAWLLIVIYVRAEQPLLTLIYTGLAYGVFAIVLSALLSPILTGRFSGPLTNPYAAVSVLITNAIWGGIIGLCAVVIRGLISAGKHNNKTIVS
jgi:hypothetical protein